MLSQDEFEKQVMEKLLACKEKMFYDLKKQYYKSKILSREFTEYGFFTTFDIPNDLAIGNIKGDIFDVVATFQNSDKVYGFRLTISDGRLDCLECFVVAGKWNSDYDNAKLEYVAKGSRKYKIR